MPGTAWTSAATTASAQQARAAGATEGAPWEIVERAWQTSRRRRVRAGIVGLAAMLLLASMAGVLTVRTAARHGSHRPAAATAGSAPVYTSADAREVLSALLSANAGDAAHANPTTGLERSMPESTGTDAGWARASVVGATERALTLPPANDTKGTGSWTSSVPSAPAGSAAAFAARPGGSHGPITWPASGPITQLFGVPELGVGAPHTGIDIAVPLGTPVRAAAAGTVAFVGGDPCCSYGYYVDLDHGNGVLTRYGHLSFPPGLRIGQRVRPGDVIGLSGSTGFSSGPHLHFEIRLRGAPVNPLFVLP